MWYSVDPWWIPGGFSLWVATFFNEKTQLKLRSAARGRTRAGDHGEGEETKKATGDEAGRSRRVGRGGAQAAQDEEVHAWRGRAGQPPALNHVVQEEPLVHSFGGGDGGRAILIRQSRPPLALSRDVQVELIDWRYPCSFFHRTRQIRFSEPCHCRDVVVGLRRVGWRHFGDRCVI